jgi:hypothetical protein
MRRILHGVIGLLGVAAGSAPAVAQDVAPLAAEDILEIYQLMDAYAQILDNCIGGGEAYAQLFTEDGRFGVSSQWGGGEKIWFSGREALIGVGGGGPGGCRTPPSQGRSFHLNINPLVTATPEGAKARSTLLTITNDTDSRGDIVHWEGGYEDSFEKTPDGWRFKTRIHVWPEIEWTDRPEDMPPRNLADE